MIATKPKLLNSSLADLRGIAQGSISISEIGRDELASYAIQLEIAKREDEHYKTPFANARARQLVPEGNPELKVVPAA